MPTDNNTNLGFTPCFWLTLRYTHGLYSKVLSRSRVPCLILKTRRETYSQPKNAEISDDFWKRRTRLYFSYYKRAFFIKALKYRRFGNDIVQSVSVTFSTARFDGYFFTIKNHLCADDYATAVCAIKSTQLKQGRTTRCVFFNTRTVSVAIWQTI